MSALAGIFKFDPRDRVNLKDLMELARGIDRTGPDGGTEFLAHNLGMAYRAFHTTPESHCEVQPLMRHGCIVTWDGRLDNRDEIRTRLNWTFDEVPSDLDLVLAAYKEWGRNCLAEFIGDWALALWDQTKQELILARDYIGVRRLFYRLDESSVAWCTTMEPLVLTSTKKLHVDLDYLAGCLYPRPPIEATPYQEIRSVIPASFLTFHHGGKYSTERYWALNPHSRIRYKTDSEYETHFLDIFRESVNRRLRADRTVVAELSGGVDSSSIVCMADDIRSRHQGVSFETLSYYDANEPSGDERPYFTLIERQRGRTGHHISVSAFTQRTEQETLEPLPSSCFSASPGQFAQSLQWASMISEIHASVGARVTLSGLGGDEVLGGVQYEAPELAEHLLAGRLHSFLFATFRWSLSRRKTVYRLLADTFELLRASYRPESMVAPNLPLYPWARLRPVKHHWALRSFARWRNLPPPLLFMESLRYNLAQQLNCIDPSSTGGTEKRYPYLDRSLFVYLASLPRTQILQAGHRRHLMRRALREIVPQEVLLRKTKWFGVRGPQALFCNQQRTLGALFEDAWLSNGDVIDASALQKHLDHVQHGAIGEGLALRAAIGIELWLRSQVREGAVYWPSSGIHDRCAASCQIPS